MHRDDPPLTREQLKALFAEWTADEAAARERDGKTIPGRDASGKVIAAPQPSMDKPQERESGIER